MNGYWNHIPIFRYIVPFVAGILVSEYFHLHSEIISFVFYLLCGLFFISQALHKLSGAFRMQVYFGAFIHLLLFSGGLFLVQSDTPLYAANYFMENADSTSIFECRLNHPPEYTEKSTRLYVDVISEIKDHNTIPVKGKSILYIRQDSLSDVQFHYGDIILIRNKFSEPATPKNPAEFNYKNYLFNLKIYHIAFLNTEDYIVSGENKSKWQWNLIFRCKEYFIQLLENNIHDPDALSVGEALIIGQKSAIAGEVQQAYANTGTMHILAVSGLHVGILFVILEFLFSPFARIAKKKSYALLIKTIFILIIIWLYACLSGLSASVNRSAVMFTFLALGKMYERRIDSFNILLVSMLPLLLDDPYQITQVGFQLSYLAVGGIIFFQPLIQNLLKPGNRIIKYFWSMTSVSIAAQLGTAPISIFYFHQFPNYFLLSNMIAIPVSFIVLVAGVAFFVFAHVPFVGNLISWILEKSLVLMNHSVIAVEKLPHSVTNNLMLTSAETILWYTVVIFAGTYFVLRRAIYFNSALCFLLCIAGLFSVRSYDQYQNSDITFYNIKDHTALLIKNGRSGYLLSDFDSLPLSDDYKFHIKSDIIAKGIKNIIPVNLQNDSADQKMLPFYLHYPVIRSGDKSFYFCDQQTVHFTIDPAPDYTIITQNPRLQIDTAIEIGGTYLIDNSNSWKINNYWMKQMKKMDVACYSIKSEGSFSIHQ